MSDKWKNNKTHVIVLLNCIRRREQNILRVAYDVGDPALVPQGKSVSGDLHKLPSPAGPASLHLRRLHLSTSSVGHSTKWKRVSLPNKMLPTPEIKSLNWKAFLKIDWRPNKIVFFFQNTKDFQEKTNFSTTPFKRLVECWCKTQGRNCRSSSNRGEVFES